MTLAEFRRDLEELVVDWPDSRWDRALRARGEAALQRMVDHQALMKAGRRR